MKKKNKLKGDKKMGQYFRCVNIDQEEFISPYDHNETAKLMEHSYIGNAFIAVACFLLENEWSGDRIVWAGDYAEPYTYKVGAKKVRKDLYDECKNSFKAKILPVGNVAYPVGKCLINLTKRLYVNLDKLIELDALIIHPLPLLTAISNGQGGGDFYGENEFVGTWAGDRLEVRDLDSINVNRKEFEEISPNFKED